MAADVAVEVVEVLTDLLHGRCDVERGRHVQPDRPARRSLGAAASRAARASRAVAGWVAGCAARAGRPGSHRGGWAVRLTGWRESSGWRIPATSGWLTMSGCATLTCGGASRPSTGCSWREARK